MENQINRAQCRVKSGTAGARNGAEAEEEICDGAVMGSVHITSIETSAEKSVGAPAGVGAMGNDCEFGVACVTQQGLWHEQQLRAGLPLAEVT